MTRSMPIDFSVIIPTFRRPEELFLAIASVLAQRGVEVEVFVIDDSAEGSAKQVVEMLRNARVNYLKNPVASGGIPSVVRNLGWPLAQATFVHFLDDDDIVPEDYYAAVKTAFIAHPEVGVVFGRVEPFGDAPEEQMRHEREFFAAAARRALRCGWFGPKLAFTGCMMFDGLLLVTGAGVVRRECVQLLGGFDPLMRVREDWDFYARAMRRFGAHFIDRVALKYRIGNRSLLHYSLDLSESDLQCLTEARQRTRAKYRAECGTLEYVALKLVTKTVLTIL
jgi:glycosyltransferase involved in cell wall biosynthesis